MNQKSFMIYIDSFSILNILMVARQYLYQSCTELGWWQTSDSKKQPFGNLFPYSFLVKELCTDIFGSNFNETSNIFGTLYTNLLNLGLGGAVSRSLTDPSILGKLLECQATYLLYLPGTLLMTFKVYIYV